MGSILTAWWETQSLTVTGDAVIDGRKGVAVYPQIHSGGTQWRGAELDRPDETPGGPRPWPRYLQSIIRSPGRCGLGNYRRRSSVSRSYRKTEHRDRGRRACADNRSNPSAEAGITSDAWHTSAQPAPRPTGGRSRAIFRCCIDFLVQTEIGRAERD